MRLWHCRSAQKVVYLRGGKLTHHPSGLIVAKDKSTSPTWADVKALLLTFDRAGLQGLVQDLYAASKDNQAFLHARFGLGPDQLGPYKATISRWINPDPKEPNFIGFKGQEGDREL